MSSICNLNLHSQDNFTKRIFPEELSKELIGQAWQKIPYYISDTLNEEYKALLKNIAVHFEYQLPKSLKQVENQTLRGLITLFLSTEVTTGDYERRRIQLLTRIAQFCSNDQKIDLTVCEAIKEQVEKLQIIQLLFGNPSESFSKEALISLCFLSKCRIVHLNDAVKICCSIVRGIGVISSKWVEQLLTLYEIGDVLDQNLLREDIRNLDEVPITKMLLQVILSQSDHIQEWICKPIPEKQHFHISRVMLQNEALCQDELLKKVLFRDVAKKL